MKNEIVIYQSKELSQHIEVRVEKETVWLNKEQIASLFGRDRSVISRHISNVFKEGELQKEEVCAFFAHTTQHGAIKGKTQVKNIEYYNLDVIISVGYRVKSKQGTQFRIWANKILKDYLLKGYVLNNRMNRIEDRVEQLSEKVNDIDLQLKTNLPPNEGVFFDGQIYDAYAFINNLLKNATQKIVLIDNYIDDTILTLFSKYPKLQFTIITQKISRQLQLDIIKYKKQYNNLEIKTSKKYHDRFLIIDNQTYHIGASLKDLGKKVFAFGKLKINILER